MKISENFDVREFVPKATWIKWGERSRWFVSPKMVTVAEFYKKFFLAYYQNKHGAGKIDKVLVVVNNWHYGGPLQYRGYRPPQYAGGGKESQHRFCNAFDCDIVIVMKDGKRVEADYKEVHQIIKQNELEFMSAGLTTVEDVSIAETWLHSDFRWTGLDHILIVKP